MESKLYVGNLPYSMTEDELKEMFAQAGTITSAVVIKDRETGRSKGFGFVEMANQAEAEKAISMFNGYRINERPLTVNIARPREERGGGGGGGGGRGGYGDRGPRRDRDDRGDRGRRW